VQWVRGLRDRFRESDPDDPPPEIRSLLMFMASYADADGRCYPSLKTLAQVMGVHPTTAKRRRNRAVDLGWLRIVSRGRWVGTKTRYQLVLKGSVGASLPAPQRGASRPPKGERGRSEKGSVGAPRSTNNFHEGGDDAGLQGPVVAFDPRTCVICDREFLGMGYELEGFPICSRRCQERWKAA
jgi:hypothetical protein